MLDAAVSTTATCYFLASTKSGEAAVVERMSEERFLNPSTPISSCPADDVSLADVSGQTVPDTDDIFDPLLFDLEPFETGNEGASTSMDAQTAIVGSTGFVDIVAQQPFFGLEIASPAASPSSTLRCIGHDVTSQSQSHAIDVQQEFPGWSNFVVRNRH